MLGWDEDNLSQDDVQREILKCVNWSCKAGLHAVVFVVNANRPFSDVTTRTLEGFLTEKVWDHIIVVLSNAEAHGEKLDAFIRSERSLHNLIQKCGHRYCELNSGITDRLEGMIAEKKKHMTYFGENVDKAQKAQITLIERFKDIIKSLQDEIDRKRQLKKNALQDQAKLAKIIALKNVEIRRLQKICRKQEEELELLRLGCQPCQSKNQEISHQEEEIAQLKATLGEQKLLCQSKDQKIEQQEEEIAQLKATLDEEKLLCQRKYLKSESASESKKCLKLFSL